MYETVSDCVSRVWHICVAEHTQDFMCVFYVGVMVKFLKMFVEEGPEGFRA